MPLRMGTDNPERQAMNQKVWAAAKYAVRSATMNGKEPDFDPDALCQNMVVGLLGFAVYTIKRVSIKPCITIKAFTDSLLD